MPMWWTAFFALRAMTGVLGDVAQEASPLAPVAAWSVEYAPNMCVLSRGFGGAPGKPLATLALRPMPLSESTEMVLAMSSSSAKVAAHGKAMVTLLPSGRRQEVSVDRRHDATTQRTITSFDMPSDFVEAMRNAQAVEYAANREQPVRLATGSLTRPLDVLMPCQDDLLRTWGYDPLLKERVGTLAKTTGGSLGSYFSRMFYPANALKADHEGRVLVSWTVDIDGKAKDCRVLNSSGHKELDLTTCAILLQRVRFRPALDRDGNPMASYQVLSVRWSLEV